LATIPSAAGYTTFDVHAGSTLTLPSLTSAAATQFYTDGGGKILVNGTQPASLSWTEFYWADGNRVWAQGAGSTIDLSAVRTLNDGYDDLSSGYSRYHQ